jgi:hypothetical protein
VLFEKRFWVGIADGSITLTFRRWKRLQVVAGRPYRTAAGIVDVTAVDVVNPSDITDTDAKSAGYPNAATLVAELRGSGDDPTYRIAFAMSRRPDPRAQLAASDDLSEADIAQIRWRLERLDRASSHGPWTRETLVLISEHPERRAGDLAEQAGRERAPFKLDVRKLKNLGLTESLPVGYRLSPRGRAYLAESGDQI